MHQKFLAQPPAVCLLHTCALILLLLLVLNHVLSLRPSPFWLTRLSAYEQLWQEESNTLNPNMKHTGGSVLPAAAGKKANNLFLTWQGSIQNRPLFNRLCVCEEDWRKGNAAWPILSMVSWFKCSSSEKTGFIMFTFYVCVWICLFLITGPFPHLHVLLLFFRPPAIPPVYFVCPV